MLFISEGGCVGTLILNHIGENSVKFLVRILVCWVVAIFTSCVLPPIMVNFFVYIFITPPAKYFAPDTLTCSLELSYVKKNKYTRNVKQLFCTVPGKCLCIWDTPPWVMVISALWSCRCARRSIAVWDSCVEQLKHVLVHS